MLSLVVVEVLAQVQVVFCVAQTVSDARRNWFVVVFLDLGKITQKLFSFFEDTVGYRQVADCLNIVTSLQIFECGQFQVVAE